MSKTRKARKAREWFMVLEGDWPIIVKKSEGACFAWMTRYRDLKEAQVNVVKVREVLPKKKRKV